MFCEWDYVFLFNKMTNIMGILAWIPEQMIHSGRGSWCTPGSRKPPWPLARFLGRCRSSSWRGSSRPSPGSSARTTPPLLRIPSPVEKKTIVKNTENNHDKQKVNGAVYKLFNATRSVREKWVGTFVTTWKTCKKIRYFFILQRGWEVVEFGINLCYVIYRQSPIFSSVTKTSF